mmetsp:Transcript_35750/g.93493  ORF Transcript_35750/g.93493 Transcript_35750/m.93493 type:complete len:108 (+) Transcript_35750:119-442(+)|eukprot:CAMPEP_0182925940 /NCGR_PEP_ID=MMETSP0105_2-20130417/10746_1 /TAXON_ID=81532 ORGANISM="Acanthoeca-like sp., Strain 10tr" /NCGR_SAMPLE_ID=MMETSP0105_2 /ASSEMBLY_ACC=CAM_ASM_000205 /LENGTH=107 /DNA_ID=CAMNT_0025063811 /DNA_START=115 /DNA_END=438 /DNA_ORIENTATION=+
MNNAEGAPAAGAAALRSAADDIGVSAEALDEKARFADMWHDASNWTTVFGRRVIYSAPTDPRILVPKQPATIGEADVPMGWTLNFAHPQSYLSLVLIAAVSYRVYKR